MGTGPPIRRAPKPTGRHTPVHPTFLTYGYVDLVDVIPCGSGWKDLLPEYEKALPEDEKALPEDEKALTDEKIDTAPLYWTDGAEDQARLAEYARMDEMMLNKLWYAAVPVPFAWGTRLALL